MIPLFSEEGLARLEEVMDGGLLCAFDFDGTLAPIVPTPDDARLPDQTRMLLQQLVELAPVAIITGRSLEDIRPRLGFEPDYVVGNHGLEGVPGWESVAAETAFICSQWCDQMRPMLATLDPGIALENKRYSISLHYRHAADPVQAAAHLESLFQTLSPAPRVVAGKFVYNLLSEERCHKGSALERLMEVAGVRHAIYVGDDVTDEDVFRLGRSDILGIRIEDSPQSNARFFIPHVDHIQQLLNQLAGGLRLRGGRSLLRRQAC